MPCLFGLHYICNSASIFVWFLWPWHFWKLQASCFIEHQFNCIFLIMSSQHYFRCAALAGQFHKRCCSSCGIPARYVKFLLSMTLFFPSAILWACTLKLNLFLISCFWSDVHLTKLFIGCFLFYSMTYHPLLSLFILMFKRSQIWPVGGPFIWLQVLLILVKK